MYNEKVITVKSHKLMLVPLQQCMGVNFGSVKRKPVSYKMKDYMAMQWDVDNCQRVADAGIQVECPALFNYNWPGRFTPFDHQRVTFNFLINNKRSFCFNDIGTSKTLSALWAADYLIRAGRIKKVLVTSTLSTLDRVWKLETFTHLMHRTCTVMHGSMQKKRRLKLLAEDHDFYIINHDGMKGMVSELAEKKFDMIIVDEGAVFRNHKTDLWKAMNYLACEDRLEWLWWLTGSPMPRAPTDVWAQAKIVKPNTVPKYFSRFREQTMFKINMFKWVPRKGWEDIVYSSIQPSIRFHRDDCVDIPPCTYVPHPVEMSAEQKKIYAGLKEHFIAEAKEGLVTAANEGVKLVKLLQVACGAIYHEDGSTSPVDCGPKFKELESICDEAGDKLILFVPFKHVILEIEEWFKKKRSSSTYGIINGGVGKGARDKIFDEFQNGSLNVILAHPAAMAHGLTLTAANVITWWGPVDDFEIYEQANGRITRPGQKRKQYIKHLTCSPVEMAVYDRLKNKESMQGIILDMIKK